MGEPPSSYLWIVSIPLVFILNSLAVAIDSAVASVDQENFEQNQNVHGSKSAIKLLSKRRDVVYAIHLLVAGSTLILGSLGYAWAYKIARFSKTFSSTWFFRESFLVAALFLIIFLVSLLLADFFGRSVGSRFASTVVRLFAGPLLVFVFFVKPFLSLSEFLASKLLKIFSLKLAFKGRRVQTLADIERLVTDDSPDSLIEIDKEEQDMLKGIFGFSDTIVREVMTPRVDLVTVPVNATFNELINVVVTSGFSRLPVVGESVDDLKGILLVKDILPAISEHILTTDPTKAVINLENFSVKNFLREAYFVPATKSIDELLNEFKSRKVHMAVVVDEHGGVDGVISLEDIIEEIVGDIYDESDEDEEDIVVTKSGDIRVDGGVLVCDLNEKLSLNIPEGDYDTVAGYVFTTLGRMPEQGDEVYIGDSLSSSELNGTKESSNQEETTNGSIQKSKVEDSEDGRIKIIVDAVNGNRIEFLRLVGLSLVQI